MFPTIKAVNMTFHNQVNVQGYHFTHTIPDAKGKFAIKIAPISSMEDITAAHSAIKTFILKHLCPKYKTPEGKPYNFGVYTPASSKPLTDFAPLIRKDRKDAIVVGWCSIMVRFR